MYYVYILSNYNNKVIYTGVTNNLERRLYEHKHHLADGFTSKYNVNKLVYFETGDSIDGAIAREKQIKSYRREKKDAIVNSVNPDWKDLSLDWNK
ncbi:GIY-YIG nuclease family protein [Anaerococcus tetradius]|uniref:GIY-YIG catalytic domain protein n=1 Tax=Anaerococcus tetradius ATCC 35098 TaxID=525255 RepID=C2CIS2_9FIRM|nr:GIY-YIG nuclease family protein [Anaerococcus tetradius]EEI82505.1 GIY-YIG catalytic domain protein [Anaerococcus tetradius ATCC 35098]